MDRVVDASQKHAALHGAGVEGAVLETVTCFLRAALGS